MRKRLLKRAALPAALVLVMLAASLPLSGAWDRVFSFFGLGGFSAEADGWPVSVHVLDVGKADSILVQCEGRSMLVDGGTADRGESVVRYLRRRGVASLEEVVNTHPDEDHVGGLNYVLQSFPVGRFFAPGLPPELVPTDSAYLAVLRELDEKGLSSEAPSPGQEFSLGDLEIRVLGPVVPGDSTNDNSIVLLLTYKNVKFLLTGDAEKEEEQSLLSSGEDLSADVLKVGHHGSSTSTTAEFLDAVRPKYAVISVGDDRNHLPKQDVLLRLYDAGAETYRTDVDGTVIFLTDGDRIDVKTEK